MHTFLLVLVTIIWGSTFFIIKDTVTDVNEFFIVFGRTLSAAAVMIVFLLGTNRKSLFNKSAIKHGVVLGALLATTYISQTIGLKYTSSGHSAFITGSAVVMVPVLLLIYFRQKISRVTILSILVVFLGLFLLTGISEARINIGDLITLITALSYANHIILAGRFVRRTDVLSMISYQFITACLISLAAFLLTGNSFIIPGPKAITAIAYLGFIGTLFCYFVSVWVQKYVSSIKVALVFSLEPVFAAMFGYLILSELLNFKELFGGTLIISGIILDQVYKHRNNSKQGVSWKD